MSENVKDVMSLLEGKQPEPASSEPEPPRKKPETPSEELAELLREDFEIQLKDNPEFATQMGFHQHDALLQKIAPHAFDERLERNKVGRQRLDAIDKSKLTATERLYAELFGEALDQESRGIELGGHLMPMNSIGNGGVYEAFIELLDWMPFDEPEDFAKYLERLMAFPQQAGDYCDLLAYGACVQGRPVSKSMMRSVSARLKQLIDGDRKELYAPLEGKLQEEDFEELRVQVGQGIDNCFVSGCKRILDFLQEFYAKRVRSNPACGSLKRGPELYNECLRFHTTTTKTAQEIHDLGLSEVARIEGRIQKEVLDALGWTGSFSEFAKSLKADPQWFYPNEEELLAGYKELVAKIEAELPKYFKKLPNGKLEIVAKTSGPAAYYYQGTSDGKRPGRFYVNTSRVKERPKYEMTALALHEGVPGHHLQGQLAVENPDLPDFLRYIEDRRYEYCPARRPLYTGYLEGWALYCEAFGEEMGLYKTPQDLFGRFSMEMMRAVRLVVDTGIHMFDWSIEKAIQYMEEKTGMATKDCEAECHRYAAWPGQACGYKVGELALRQMRAKAEKELGGKFDLPAFHDLIVGAGPQPLDFLERRIDEWIATQK
eukprot:TRINITY_DN121339_c0_g1_i1.p1 TRINITY_DN121339_c0_g1~~TRINITY_DN121339_c0_g1_i1.p1  ORF type:complete len:601 (+),score=179.50 TRINITY_DN121339_c0_g1_i1:101-1903(+)